MKPSGNIARLTTTLVVMLLMAPWVIWASQRTLASMFNEPVDWVPASFPYRRNHELLKQHFAASDTVILSWPGCKIQDDRLEQFSQSLTPSAGDPAEPSRQLYVRRAVSGNQLLGVLTSPQFGLSRTEALQRLQGSFVGADGQTTCILIVLTERGAAERQAALDWIQQQASAFFDVPTQQLRLAGSPVDGATIDQESGRSIRRYTFISLVVSLLLCWWCLRSWWLTAIIALVSAFGQGLTLSVVALSGETMNAILIVLPSLILVLTTSAGVHLSNYYRDAVRQFGCEGAPARAIAAGWLPCSLATLTTAIGLGSLVVSQMTPIATFSIASCIGVLSTLALLFLVLPGAMELHRRSKAGARWASSGQAEFDDHLLVRLAAIVAARPKSITVVFLLVMAALVWGFATVRTSVNTHSLFVPRSRIMRDYRWFEQHLGPLVTVDVIVRFPSQCEMPPLDRLRLIRQLEAQIAQLPSVGGITSAGTFFPEIPSGGGFRMISRRAALKKRLERELPRMQDLGYVACIPPTGADGEPTCRGNEQLWRINARASALQEYRYGALLESLHQRVEGIVDQPSTPQLSVIYTGSLPVSYEAQHALLRDLFRSFLTAFALVAVVMVVALRSLLAGVLAMLPNVFPTLMMFGLMGWLGIAVNIGSVMTASVALGIAVDDTLHFLTWYRRETDRGLNRVEAIHRCFRHCGRAMTQTTLICGLGLMAYGLSEFVPTQRFAWFMLTLLMAALVGDLVFLPALLLSPLGKFFLRDRGRRESP